MKTIRLTLLIKELFDLAKMDQNTFVIEKERFNLNEFFTKISTSSLLFFMKKDEVHLRLPAKSYVES